MERIRITLKGLPPGQFQNKMGMDELLALRDKTTKKSKTAARPTLEEEAAKHIHYNGDGKPCVPKDMLMATLINAGVFIRLDQKRQLSTQKSTLLPGLLTLEGTSWPLLVPSEGDESKWGYASWRYETRKGKNPNGGEAVCIVRPLFEIWAITFTCLLDTDELAEDTFLKLFTLAGTRIGLADFRPQCKGTFGKFAVIRWDKRGEEIEDVSRLLKKKAAA